VGVEPHQGLDHSHLAVFTLAFPVHLDPLGESTHEGRFSAHLWILIAVADAAAEGVEEETFHRVYRWHH